MSDGEREGLASRATAHSAAAEAFVERARAITGEELRGLYLFGSTVRGDTRGLASDVDVLVVLDDSVEPSVADRLREVAYDVMLEFGPVVELHVFSESEFETARRRRNPFVRNVVSEGQSYA